MLSDRRHKSWQADSKSVPLRRLDWRFLLPPPPAGGHESALLLGGPSGMGERIREVGWARTILKSLDGGRMVDAVIVLHDAAVRVDDVARVLRPGGVLYWEINRASRGRHTFFPGRIWSSLVRARLLPLCLFAVRPFFDACELYLPLLAPTALRWYMTTQYIATTRRQRTLESALRATTGLNVNRFASIVPYLAVTAMAPANKRAARHTLDHPIFPEAIQKAMLYPAVIVGGEDGGNRATILPFTRESQEPIMVVKVPKLPRFNEKCRVEQEVLGQLHAQLDPTLRTALPQPRGLYWLDELLVSIEGYLPGQSIARSGGHWGVPLQERMKDFQSVTEWLTEFHRHTRREIIHWGSESGAGAVAKMLQDYTTRFGGAEVSDLFGRVQQRSAMLAKQPFSLVWQHRDFNIWNIYRAGNQLSILDWEGGQQGLPLCDLLHFVTHWNDNIHRLQSEMERRNAFGNLFLHRIRSDSVVVAIDQALDHYMRQLLIPPGLLPVLLVYTWVELALRRHAQQTAMGVTDEHFSSNRFLDYVRLLSQHSSALFEAE